jgi:hypothetical protein
MPGRDRSLVYALAGAAGQLLQPGPKWEGEQPAACSVAGPQHTQLQPVATRSANSHYGSVRRPQTTQQQCWCTKLVHWQGAQFVCFTCICAVRQTCAARCSVWPPLLQVCACAARLAVTVTCRKTPSCRAAAGGQCGAGPQVRAPASGAEGCCCCYIPRSGSAAHQQGPGLSPHRAARLVMQPCCVNMSTPRVATHVWALLHHYVCC